MSDASRISSTSAPNHFLSGGGELGRLIRAYDWRATPLGDPEAWTQNLKLALRIMLNSPQPMWIGWGPSLVYFYNDAYRSIVGGKHPRALGRPIAEVWHELWDDIGEMLELAMTGRDATYVEVRPLIMERNGYREETYYTFSCSPIPVDDDDGGVGGVICANTDDTQRVIGERQFALLCDLAAGAADARNGQEASECSLEALRTHPRDLPFAMLYLAELGETDVKLLGASGIDAGHEAAPVRISQDEPNLWPVREALRTHAPVLVSDLAARVRSPLPRGPWQEAPSQGVVVPILPSGETGRAGALVVGLNPFRLFDANYRGFLSLVAGQISAAITRAQAYKEERRRAEALAEIDWVKTTFFSNVSHEFRTPLTLMLGPLEDALADTTTTQALAPSQRQRLETAHHNGLRLLELVNSLLDFSRIGAGRVVLQEANAVLERRVAAAIAERAHTEVQLRQAQKMEAIGKLTGGVAHDFNNVLQVIAGNLQLLGRDVAGNVRAEQRLQTAVAATSRGSRLASQLLAFGRRQPLSPKTVNLGRLVRGIDDLLRRSLGEGVEIETAIAGGLWNTFVDTVQVETALLNLAINARDAMQGQGTLTIEAGNAFLDDTYVARHGDVAAGQYVMVAVTDTGCGIPAELLERVFEPFYTTKPEGRGTGLGLSMVYGFVKQSGGHIKIDSEAGHGTTVRIYLPRARQPEDVETDLETGPITGGSETVLVVEDDEDVRGTVVDLLSELGYRVLRAKDAQSALAIVESGVPIDLLFTDVVMPGPLGSPELARTARERLPNVAVLFTSGYTDNAIVHGGRLDEGVDLLSKPYSREAMARKIRSVLRNQPRGKIAAAPASLPPPSESEEALPDASRAAARVLLVDDDAMVRFTTADMLSYLGHIVTEAGDATDALRLLSEQAFDILVTDISLPDLSGDELAMRALALQPGLRVIFATGYDALPEDSDHQALAGTMLLRKPYNQERIEEAMKSAMAARLAAGASRTASEERSAPAPTSKNARRMESM